MKTLELYFVNLHLFATNKTTDTTASTGNDLSGEMKTFYSDYLIDLVEPELVHDQFGQQVDIPANGGKTVEFRKYDSLPKALTPLEEGVTPNGQKINMGVITSTVHQYGGFVELSDILLMTAIDNNLVEATKLLASQATRTLDTITREVLAQGTSVMYYDGSVADRCALVGGEASGNHYLTVDCIRRAVRFLKVMNAPRINGDYVGIIHPDVSYDLMNDPKWINVKTYSDPEGIYNGEIGKLEGVRFVETTEAKIFAEEDLASDSRTLLVNNGAGYTGSITTIAFDGGTVATNALKGRYILINGVSAKVTANTSSTITVEATNFGTVSDNTVIYAGDAGAKGRAVYGTLILGANAYGVTKLANGGLKHIVKQLGSAGTSDPLDQRATAGWKATKTAEILVEQYMVRIETASSFDADSN